MTAVTPCCGNRVVNAFLEQFWLVRCMGVMTAGAGLAFNRITAVGFFERRAGLVMTSQAERRFGLGQQEALVRAVGDVAGLAALFAQYCMNNLLLEGLFFVAAVTDVISLRHQHGWRRRAVGVMALRTFARLERRMKIFSGQPDLGRAVAVQADLVAVFLEQQFGHSSVSEMTTLAFFLLDDRVKVFLRKILRFKFRVAIQAFLTGHFLGGMAVRRDPVP